MIISRTPFRISFLGGGTDYPAWYRAHGGAVLGTTIDKYCYLTCRYLPPFFEHRLRVVWSKIENCQTVEEITHPAVRATLQYLNPRKGLEIHHDGDLPARSGIGSSSSFVVGLLHALHALEGRMVSKTRLADEAIHIEQEILNETVGSQDQVLAAHGGLNHVCFLPNGAISVTPVTLSRERLEAFNEHLMLFFTGIRRTSSDVAETSLRQMEANKRHLRVMTDLVGEGIAILNSGDDLLRFGGLLREAWQLKRELGPKVSTPQIDEIYQEAISAGAVGGKIMGAGSGGFMLLFVPPTRQEAVRERLRGMISVPFRFDHDGSRIIFFDPEEDFTVAENIRSRHNIAPFREAGGE